MSDVRNRPVVLDTGVLGPVPRGRGRAARAVLGVALVAVLATGAVAAGGWSIMTAALGGTPPEGPASLWYKPPQKVGEAASAGPVKTTAPAPAATRRVVNSAPVPKRTVSAPRATRVTPTRTSGGGSGKGGKGSSTTARPSSSADDHGGDKGGDSDDKGSGSDDSDDSGKGGKGKDD